MQDAKYFSHSWELLTRDKGWVKPILVLAIAMFVPILGPLAVLGYALEWARLSAWGVDAAPKQRGVKIGGCLVAGWRAFVVILVWMLLWSVATSVVDYCGLAHQAPEFAALACHHGGKPASLARGDGGGPSCGHLSEDWRRPVVRAHLRDGLA